MSEPILVVRDVRKSYRLGRSVIEVLRGVDWELERGAWACLVGASGSGKTTLLNLLGSLEAPDTGTIVCAGTDYAGLRRRRAAAFRNRKLGFVFQAYCLLPEFTVLENVMLPGRFSGRNLHALRSRAEELLERVGLADRLHHRPGELSGGEQQRAAIARALINDPELLLADEPTGNLDARTGASILALFRELRAADPGRTMVMITHNPEIAAEAEIVRTLRDGVLQ